MSKRSANPPRYMIIPESPQRHAIVKIANSPITHISVGVVIGILLSKLISEAD